LSTLGAALVERLGDLFGGLRRNPPKIKLCSTYWNDIGVGRMSEDENGRGASKAEA
jgi:hypothetical protein